LGLPRKLGVVSDLHANFEALKVALRWLADHDVQDVVCLGDIIGYNANPVEVTYLAWERLSFAIKGNHERYVLGEEARGVKDEKLEVIRWTRDQLSEEYLGWLRALPDSHLLDGAVLLTHGSPRDPDEYVFKKSTAEEGLRYLGEKYPGVRLCFLGHTHLPMLIGAQGIDARFGETRTVELDPKGTYMINPGSVGQPRDGVPKTAFGVLDTKRWSFTWVRLPYDHETTAARIRDAGLDATMASRLARGK